MHIVHLRKIRGCGSGESPPLRVGLHSKQSRIQAPKLEIQGAAPLSQNAVLSMSSRAKRDIEVDDKNFVFCWTLTARGCPCTEIHSGALCSILDLHRAPPSDSDPIQLKNASRPEHQPSGTGSRSVRGCNSEVWDWIVRGPWRPLTLERLFANSLAASLAQ